MRKAQLRWAGHVSGMPDDGIPIMQLLHGELCQGERTVGEKRKRDPRAAEGSTLKTSTLALKSWELLTSDRPSWRNSIVKGAHTAEERRSIQAEQKRAAPAQVGTSTNSTASTHLCPNYGRDFLSRIGLISHLWTHRSSSSANYMPWSSSNSMDEEQQQK